MGNGRAIPRDEAEKSHPRPGAVDHAVAALAAEQEGRISRRQLLALGLNDDAIASRVLGGRLHRLRHGVYAVGHPGGTDRSRIREALLSVGEDCIVSHLSGAAEHAIRLPAPRVVDLSCTRALRQRPGIRLHRRRIGNEEMCSVGGLPVTTPARTLFDLAGLLGSRSLKKAANEAFVRRIVTIDELAAVADRQRGRKGSVAFGRLLDVLDPDARRIRSPLEARVNEFLRDRGFPPFEANKRLRIGDDVIEADVLWRSHRVIVEADGRDPHLAPVTFSSDRRRDRRLSARGWTPVRITALDLDVRPDELEADLRAILGPPPRQ